MLTKTLVWSPTLQRAPQGQPCSRLGAATGVRGPAGGAFHGAKACATALSFLPPTLFKHMVETNVFFKVLLETPLREGISEMGLKPPQAGVAAGVCGGLSQAV